MAERPAPDELDGREGPDRRARGTRRRAAACAATSRPRSTASPMPPARRGPRRPSTGDPRDRRRASCTRRTSTSPCTTRARRTINFPYYVDAVDVDIPDPGAWEPFGVGNAPGSTAYVLRTGRPLLIDARRLPAPRWRRARSSSVGVTSRRRLAGGPARAEGRTLGVLVVQSYSRAHLHARRPRPARLRRPARRHRAEPRAGHRRDAPAERRAGRHQRDRRRPRQPARLRGDHRARRRTAANAVPRRSRCSSRPVRRAVGHDHVPVRDRRGRPESRAAPSRSARA